MAAAEAFPARLPPPPAPDQKCSRLMGCPRSLKISRDDPRVFQDRPSSRQGGEDRSKIGLSVSQDRYKTLEHRSQKLQERSKIDQEQPRELLERSWGHLAAFRSYLGIENVFFLTISNTFWEFVVLRQHLFRRHLGAQFAATWLVESCQEHPKSSQAILKRSPRVSQTAQEGRKSSQDQSQMHPKSGPTAAKSGPRATQSDPRAAKRGPRASQNCGDEFKSGREGPKTVLDFPKEAPSLPRPLRGAPNAVQEARRSQEW